MGASVLVWSPWAASSPKRWRILSLWRFGCWDDLYSSALELVCLECNHGLASFWGRYLNGSTPCWQVHPCCPVWQEHPKDFRSGSFCLLHASHSECLIPPGSGLGLGSGSLPSISPLAVPKDHLLFHGAILMWSQSQRQKCKPNKAERLWEWEEREGVSRHNWDPLSKG